MKIMFYFSYLQQQTRNMAAANVQGTLKVESQVLHVDKDYRGENLGEPIALFQDGVVLVSWKGLPCVMKLDRQKKSK